MRCSTAQAIAGSWGAGWSGRCSNSSRALCTLAPGRVFVFAGPIANRGPMPSADKRNQTGPSDAQ
jgi:hypothetical protein